MRNFLSFSASALIHGLLFLGAGYIILTAPAQPAAKKMTDVLNWQWVNEPPPPPPPPPAPPEPQPEPVPPPPPPEPQPAPEPPPPAPKPLPKPAPKPAPKPKPVPKVHAKKRPPKKVVRRKPRPAPATREQVITQAAPAPAPTPTRVTAPPAVSRAPAKPARVAVSANALANYRYGLRQAIERNKRYPAREQRMGVMGTTMVAFVVNRDGRISNIRVVASSGNSRLDAAARNAVAAVGRYLPPPSGQPSEMQIALDFVLR